MAPKDRSPQRLSSGNFQGVSPVLLSSSADVLANNSAVPDSGQLSYPFRKAIFIEEIRWTLRISSGTALNLGSIVRTKMSLGQKYLMRDQVPIWLLGTSMANTQEEASDSLLTTPFAYSHYRWRLPEPLYVEAGEVLSCAFFRGIDGFGSINVQVAYCGRTVAPNHPRPSVIPVPYAAVWTTAAGDTFAQSNENHLFNPFDVPIRVQRLTGRAFSFVSGTTLTQRNIPTANASNTHMTILMNDSWGGKMVNNPTGPSDVFDIVRSAWTVDTIMPPKGVYEIRGQNLNLPSDFSGLTLHVGMIGTREEAV